jgi:alcohol dehydrogenase YqhD (iron-dependent ADH family)
VLERYFTNTTYVDCTDRICEGLLRTLVKYGTIVRDDPRNVEVRAELMWACKLAHDNTAGFGRKHDWACHAVAHELGALCDRPHGSILAVIFPAWMRYVYKGRTERFSQFAERVFDLPCDRGGVEQTIQGAIEKFSQFLRLLGMPRTVRDLGIHEKARLAEVSKKAVRFMQSGTIGNFVRLSPSDVSAILDLAF